MNRRDLLKRTGAVALAAGAFPFPLPADEAPKDKKRILMYTRSEGFQHSVVQRKGTELSLAENIVTDLGKKHKIEVVCEKDGRVFLSKDFPTFDGFLFETQGDLIKEQCKDGSPPMTLDGKKALLNAIEEGKGFVGCHCASDTFHSLTERTKNDPPEKRDPYIAMLGGEFIRHGAQQKAWMRVTEDKFKGLEELKDYEMNEEWYSLKNFAPDIHVILVQDTKGMKNVDYERPPFPATWARMHKKGRVFYTSMGHREDVWQSPVMTQVLTAALAWTLGRTEAKLVANLDKATPMASTLPDFTKKN